VVTMFTKNRKCVVTLTVLALSLAAAVPAAQADLIAYWNADQGTGTSLTDQTSNHINGTLSGAGWSTSGRFGNALSTGSISVDLTANALLPSSTSDFTYSLWFKGTTSDSWRWLISQNPGYGPNILFITTQDKVRVAIGTWFADAFNNQVTTFSDTIWYQLTVTREGTTVKAYVNGALDASGTSSGNGGNIGSHLYLSKGPVNQHFNGLMDDIAVFNTSLSSGQSRAIYNLANEAGLNYNFGEVKKLFGLTSAGQNTTTSDGKNWYYVTGLTGAEGAVQTLPGGNYAVNFGSGNGVSTIILEPGDIPEPATMALLGLAAAGLGGYIRRRRTA